jgi:hypothetical protein
MQKRFRSHGNERPKHNNSKERDNSTVEGGDLHTVRPKPISGRELTDRRQTEVRSEVLILCGVVTVISRVLSLFVVTKRYSYHKLVLQLIVFLPGEYSVNRFI